MRLILRFESAIGSTEMLGIVQVPQDDLWKCSSLLTYSREIDCWKMSYTEMVNAQFFMRSC